MIVTDGCGNGRVCSVNDAVASRVMSRQICKSLTIESLLEGEDIITHLMQVLQAAKDNHQRVVLAQVRPPRSKVRIGNHKYDCGNAIASSQSVMLSLCLNLVISAGLVMTASLIVGTAP